MNKYISRLLAVLLIILVFNSFTAISAFAISDNDSIVLSQAENTITINSMDMDEEGYHHWSSLALALNRYGALFAVYEGRYHDILGPYDRYYIQMTGWKIHFGVNAT